MKTSINKIDENTRELSIELEPEVVKKKFEEIYTKLAEEVKVDGFRPGKAPRHILEKHHAHLANERLLNELIPSSCEEAAKSSDLQVAALTEVKDIDLKSDHLSFKATLEIKPPIKLKEYKGIRIEHKKVEVSEEEIKNTEEEIKKSRKIDSIDDNFARSIGYCSAQELEEFLRHNLYIQKSARQRDEIENKVVEKILKEAEFQVPASFVKRQLSELVAQAKNDLAMRGLTKEQIDTEEENIVNRLKPEAERQVRVYLVLEEVARRESIKIDNSMPRRVMEFLLSQADWKNVQ